MGRWLGVGVLVAAILWGGCSSSRTQSKSSPPTNDVPVEARLVPGSDGRQHVAVSGTACGKLQPHVQVDGSRIVVTATGDKPRADGVCKNGKRPTPQHLDVKLSVPKGFYSLQASAKPKPTLLTEPSTMPATKPARTSPTTRAPATRPPTTTKVLTGLTELTNAAVTELTKKMPGWSNEGCDADTIFDGTNFDFDPTYVCTMTVPEAYSDQYDEFPIVPPGALKSAFGCTPRDDEENDETTCAATLHGTKVVIHVARFVDEATLALDITP